MTQNESNHWTSTQIASEIKDEDITEFQDIIGGSELQNNINEDHNVVGSNDGSEVQSTNSQSTTGAKSNKNPYVALFLSSFGMFIPFAAGAGQMYNGDVGRGIAFSFIQCVHIVLVITLFWLIIPFFTYFFAGLYFAYDAYNTCPRNA